MVKKNLWLILIWLTLIIFFPGIIYLKTLLPGPGFHDVGELQTACCTLGIAHPPGYPTYVILGKIFTLLIPFNNVAWRVNFMSAFFSVISLVLFFIICLKIYRSFWSSGITTLILAFTKNFWEFSLIAEMYSLNVFFFLLAIYWLTFTFKINREVSLRKFLLFFFVIGLAQGNHRGITLVTPIIFLFIFLNKKTMFLDFKNLIRFFLAFILGLSIYLFLPLRSLQNPYLNYARPTNWKNFKYLVLAEQFRFLMFTVPLKKIFTERLFWFWQFLKEQFFIWGIVLALIGIIWLLKNRKFYFFFLISLMFLINSFVWLAYNTHDINRYLTPSITMIAFFIAGGIKTIFSLTTILKNIYLKSLLLFFLIIILTPFPIFLLKKNYKIVDRSQDNESRQWGTAVLTKLKPNALIISHWGYSGSLWYLQGCEGLRPDVFVADERVILDENWGSKVEVVKRFFNKRPVYTIVYEPFINEITQAGYNYLDEYWFYEIVAK